MRNKPLGIPCRRDEIFRYDPKTKIPNTPQKNPQLVANNILIVVTITSIDPMCKIVGIKFLTLNIALFSPKSNRCTRAEESNRPLKANHIFAAIVLLFSFRFNVILSDQKKNLWISSRYVLISSKQRKDWHVPNLASPRTRWYAIRMTSTYLSIYTAAKCCHLNNCPIRPTFHPCYQRVCHFFLSFFS